MSFWKHYYLAKNVPDALQVLTESEGLARIIAGGTDLLLDIQQGRHPPVHTLVDVNSIEEMTSVAILTDRLFIGAAVPLNRLVAASLVQHHARALAEACRLIGGSQVRNVATLGGNVAHALPAADGSIALHALDAVVEIATLAGRRRLLIEEIYQGPGVSKLALNELLVGFHIPLKLLGQGSAFKRVMRPQGVALPILNMAVWIWRDAEIVRDVRIALGPSGLVPMRARNCENMMKGRIFGRSLIRDTINTLRGEVHFRTSSHRATAGYRDHLAEVLFKQVMEAAWDNCQYR